MADPVVLLDNARQPELALLTGEQRSRLPGMRNGAT